MAGGAYAGDPALDTEQRQRMQVLYDLQNYFMESSADDLVVMADYVLTSSKPKNYYTAQFEAVEAE